MTTSPPSPDDPAIEALLRTLDDDADPLHGDYTPSVHALVAIGLPALPGLLDKLAAPDRHTRLRAERAVQGISRTAFGHDGQTWPPGDYDRWAAFWRGIGYDSGADDEARAAAIDRLRRWAGL